MTRFYPDAVPEFPHEPTRERFAIQSIGRGMGEGVVALTPFHAGEIVFRFTGFFCSDITLFTLQVEPGVYLHDPYFMGKILHRCDPNCDVDMVTRTFTARRRILPGDWVTMNYEQTEDRLFRPFTCHCGERPCEGTLPHEIKGRLVA
ncbi:MAG: SET domain-containing protein-lysine N-methyltransferase [Alphaproteobacteria bacterium]|nr:SET domain-containing protein-lysine N-methyltransferase [Alphaproteobacteria bacterium]MCB9931217.1 SET domain-containing protein-lysine N-methyltransferase [Alphaproteobacteria bacterium]